MMLHNVLWDIDIALGKVLKCLSPDGCKYAGVALACYPFEYLLFQCYEQRITSSSESFKMLTSALAVLSLATYASALVK